MDNPYQEQNQEVCKKHNLPILLIDQQLNIPMCLTCIQQKTGMVSIDQIKQKKQEIQIQGDNKFQQEQQQLQQLLDSILKYKENLIQGINKIIQIINEQIQNIKITKEQFKQQIIDGNQLNKLEQLKDKLNNQEDIHNKVKIQIKQQLSEFQQKYINIDYLKEILIQSNDIILKQDDQDKKKQKIQIQEMKQEKIQKLGKFRYELVDQSGMKEKENCYAFAFNKDNTVLVIGCESMIKIYQFINGKIGKELQVIQDHNDYVNCLYFMRQSNCFVSGSKDNSIIIWKLDTENQWVLYQMLTEHNGSVNCLLMNKNEDLLISGSDDKTIKFWGKLQDKWCCKQTIQFDGTILEMSLNEMENKLITCDSDAQIYIMEIQDNNQWSIKQKIEADQIGTRLCFTLGDQFVFQSYEKDYIEIFDFDSNSNEFRKLKQVQIQNCSDVNFYFPCQFVKSLNILFMNNAQFFYIFRINEDKNYELIQTIQYENYYISGTISNDGQHLIIWDLDSEEIQVRKLKYMND